MISFRNTTLEQLFASYRVGVDEFRGAARVAVPIRASAGREGFGPALALEYGEGRSAFGLGWRLTGLPSIAIDTSRGHPVYREGEDRFVGPGGELVLARERVAGEWLPDGIDGAHRVERYRCRVERSFERYERWIDRSGRSFWIVRARNGVVSVFGRRSDGTSRIADPADPDRRTFQWLLEAQFHPKGSAIEYRYKAEDGAGVDASAPYEARRARSAQRYPKRVLYGNSVPLSLEEPEDARNEWHFEIVFDYGEHDLSPDEERAWPARSDPFSAHRFGFEVRTHRRCRRVLVFHRFAELGPRACLVAATELGHRASSAGAELETITYRGYRKDLSTGAMDERALPPLRFTYERPSVAPSFEPALATDHLPSGIDGRYRLVDLNGEGLPGILTSNGAAWYYKENLGGGRFGPMEPVHELPSAPHSFSLGDFDSDGNLELAGFEGREAGRFERDRDEARWSGFQAFARIARADFANGRVQVLDLNGDGYADFLVERDDRWVWFPSEGAHGHGAPIEIEKPDFRGPPTAISNPRLALFFADMSGDGLLDIVRVSSGRVEYWPNLGHGRFGAAIEMDNAPSLDRELDPRRLHFVDLDGSGSSDLLYVGRGEILIFRNENGNRFAGAERIANLPYIDEHAAVRIADFFGDGTRALVWSTALPTKEGRALETLRLSDVPSRRLVAIENGIGRETRIEHRWSAADYLRDKAEGRPWHTLAPRHGSVVAAIEERDRPRGTRTIARYEYHDGYFDDGERRFVGFGCVDAFDTDDRFIESSSMELGTPGARVRSYYHTGTSRGFDERARDFYPGDRLPEPVLAGTLSTEEQLDAYRALAGEKWQQEIYADGATVPIRTSELAYRVQILERAGGPHRAAFSFESSESLRVEYEGEPDDPRTTHDLLLERDEYGNVRSQISIAYGRRSAEAHAEQRVPFVVLVERAQRNFDERDRFEIGIETEERRYALASPAVGTGVLDRATIAREVARAARIGSHDPPSEPHARLLSWRRNRYWDDARSSALAPGEVGALSLLHHVERAAFPAGAIAETFGGRVSHDMMIGAHYRAADDHYWTEDATYSYGERARFHRVERATRPNGGREIVEFDPHALVPIAIEDAFANGVSCTIDYRYVAPARIVDPNGNVAEVLYDPLAIVRAAAAFGDVLAPDGRVYGRGSDPLATFVERSGATTGDALGDPEGTLQGAATALSYDLESGARTGGPVRVVELSRETHVHDGEGGASRSGRIAITVRYLDGAGRTLETKTLADPGPAIVRRPDGVDVEHAEARWLTTGHALYDEKGAVVREYEPYFAASAEYDEDRLRHGASTRTGCDAGGRVVRHDFENGTSSTRRVRAWSTEERDPNDNVAGSPYEAERREREASDPEHDALEKTLAHAGTPVISEHDPSGRTFLRREPAGALERTTRTIYGALGLVDHVVDPRGIRALSYRYDMLGRVAAEQSADAGEKTMLLDADGRLVHAWDALGVHTERRYDANGRPVETLVDRVIERYAYGDDPLVERASERNARGRLVECCDEAGVVYVDLYDLGGEALVTRRVLREERTPVDWRGDVPLEAAEHRSATHVDALGRVLTKSLPDGTSRRYAYARLGHVRSVFVVADGVETAIASDIDVNALGQRTRSLAGNGVETVHEYDASTHRLARLRVRAGARDYLDVAYTYDPAGNVTRVLDRAHDPGASTPLLRGLGVSAACDYRYDAFYRLVEATGRVHRALLAHDYRSGLDDANAIKGTRHLSLENGAAIEHYTRTYEYDLSGNLERMRHDALSRSWVTENWISETDNRTLARRDLNGIEIVDPAARFDRCGNTIRLPHLRALEWDRARLVRAVIIDRSDRGEPDDAEHYVYGADGFRVRRITERLAGGAIETTETTYLDECEIRTVRRGGYTELLRFTSHVSDGSARVATLHRWSIDRNALETDDVRTSRLHYLFGNHLGSVALELDRSGDVISYEEFFPYGGTSFLASRSEREVKLKEYRYSGKCRDDATGLYYYGHRYYAPFTTSWLSPDPAGAIDGVNLYRFVHNNPIRFVDATGLAAAMEPEPPPRRRRGGEGSRDAGGRGPPEREPSGTTGDGGGGAEGEGDRGGRGERPDRGDSEGGRDPEGGGGTPGDRGGGPAESERGGEAPDGVLPPPPDQPPEGVPDPMQFPSDEGVPAPMPEGDEAETPPPVPGAEEGPTVSGGDEEDSEPPDIYIWWPDDEPPRPRMPCLAYLIGGECEEQPGDPGESPGRGRGAQGQGEGAGAGDDPNGGRSSDSHPGLGPPGECSDGPGREGGTSDAPEEGGGEERGGSESTSDATRTGDGRVGDAGGGGDRGRGTEGDDPRGLPGMDGGSSVAPDGTLAHEDGTGRPIDSGQLAPDDGVSPIRAVYDENDDGPFRWPWEIPWSRIESVDWLSFAPAALDALQIILDIVGLIPVIGEIADGINGLISLARGDYAGAALAFAAMIPFAGWAATGGKFGRRIVSALLPYTDEIGAFVMRYGDQAYAAVRSFADEVANASRTIMNIVGGGPIGGGGSRRLVIGAGRANRMPGMARAGDLTLDMQRGVDPDFIGNINNALTTIRTNPNRVGLGTLVAESPFTEVFIERAPLVDAPIHTLFGVTDAGLTNAVSLVRPGGRVEGLVPMLSQGAAETMFQRAGLANVSSTVRQFGGDTLLYVVGHKP